MRILLLGLSLLFLSVASNAQTCNLTIKQAPKLRGISLGMSYQDFIKLTSSNKQSRTGLGDTWIHMELESFHDERFKDIQSIDADFLNHRLASYGVSYLDPAYRVNDLNQFAKLVSLKLGLPGKWTYQPELNAAQLPCKGFWVGINSQYHLITIFDTKMSARIDKLDKRPGAKDKQVIKP